MNLRIVAHSEIDEQIWKKFIHEHPWRNPFYLPTYFNFFRNLKGFEPISIFCIDDNEIIQGILCGVIQENGHGIKRSLSRRMIMYSPPLAKNNNSFVIELLLMKWSCIAKKRRVIYSEIRNSSDTSLISNLMRKNSYKYLRYLNRRIELTNEHDVLSGMSSSRRRQLKIAERTSEIIDQPDENEICEWYKILSNNYKRKVRKPLPGKEFFLKFAKNNELGKIFLVKKGQRIIGGILCPVLSDYCIYEWYISGLDLEFKADYPSVLSTYAPIKFGLKNKIPIFDFMGAGKANTTYGVREFKSRFGGELVEYGRYQSVHFPILYFFGKIGLKFLGLFNKT